MPDRNQQSQQSQQSQRQNPDENLNAKEPSEIDKAPQQDIEKVILDPQKEQRTAEGDLTSESKQP